MDSNNKVLRYLIIGALLAVPITLLIMPANYFDEGEAICLSVILLDTECFGCGITRGIMHLIHADFQAAWEFNKLSFIVLPILGLLWLKLLLWQFDIKILRWL